MILTLDALKMTHIEAKKASGRAYGATHGEQRREYWEANREALSAQHRGWLVEHKEQVRETAAAYQQLHADELCEYQREYNASEAGKARTTKYNNGHLQERRNRACAYRQTPKGVIVHRMTERKRRQEKRAVGKLDNVAFYAKCADLQWHCQLCGRELSIENVTIDHIVPISKGGTNAIENLQPLCFRCNCSKHDRPMKAMVGSQYLFD